MTLSRNKQLILVIAVFFVTTFVVALHPAWITGVSTAAIIVGWLWVFWYGHALRRYGELIFETSEYVSVSNVQSSEVTRILYLSWFGYRYVRAGFMQEPIAFAYHDQAYRFMAKGTCTISTPHSFRRITKIKRS